MNSALILKRPILRIMLFVVLPILIVIVYVGFQIVVLVGQVDKYQAYWNENNLQPAQRNAITYVALGDSSAQSIGASSPKKGYVGLIAKSIHESTNRPVKIINLSKSGAKIEDVTNDQLTKLKEYNLPADTIYTMQIGANDVVKNFSPDDFKKHMKELLPLLPDNIVMSDVPSFKNTRFSGADKDAKEANKILYKLVKPYGYELAPLYDVTNSRASWLNNSIDLFHPNNRGYKNWHDAFWKNIETKLPS